MNYYKLLITRLKFIVKTKKKRKGKFRKFSSQPMIYITQYHEYFERKKKITSPDKYFTSKPIYFHRSVYHSRILFLPEKGKVKKKKKRILPAANSSSAPTIPSRSPQPPVSVTRNKLPLSR